MCPFAVTFRRFFALVGLVALGACSTTSGGFPDDRPLRDASDMPDHFLVGAPESAETSAPVAGGPCRNPMVDPRDGMRLVLARSSGGLGDYEVPAGRYGVGERELLRLDCGTGRAVGVVGR